MYEDLSTRQIDILKYITDVINKEGYPPSVREIGAAVGLKSPSSVFFHLEALERLGYITKDKMKKRSWVPTSIVQYVSVPVIGNVAAGVPILAEENVEEYFPLPNKFSGTNEMFMLRIVGDSMINAGILDGDYVMVEKCCDASNGEIVVAMIGNEATAKTYYKENGQIRLQPENDAFKPIYCTDVTILGIVKGLFRVM